MSDITDNRSRLEIEMAVKKHNVADYLKTPEAVAAFIEEFLGDDSETFIAALGEVASSVGFAKLAEHAGVKRQHLYQMLSENGNPTYANLSKIVAAMGCRLSIIPIDDESPLYSTG